MTNGVESQINGPQEAVKTYIEQTKLLVSLASAFILAPAAALPFIGNTGATPSHAKFLLLVSGEVLFVLSVLAGYLVLGTIAGNQHLNKFDVYRAATKWCSRIQIGFYLLGLIFFLIFLLSVIHLQERTVTPQSHFPEGPPWQMAMNKQAILR